MGKCTFKGGCHPYDGKEFSKDKPIKELFPAVGEMVFPLSQHIGAPAKPVVAKGDYVLAGQLIAEAGGFVSANIHSSVSGTVKLLSQEHWLQAVSAILSLSRMMANSKKLNIHL